MVINHLLNGMILQVVFGCEISDEHVDQKFGKKDVLGFMEKWHLPA